jgi:hypothetical protein
MALYLEIRGERQWAAAVGKAGRVAGLTIHGPAGLSLEGIERMTGLRHVTFWEGAPTDQLHRLSGLDELEWVTLQLGDGPHDLESVAGWRVGTLSVDAMNARRALELARMSFAEVRGLEALTVHNHAPALVSWDCRWLPQAVALRELKVMGFYPDSPDSWAAVHVMRQLRTIWWHDQDGQRSAAWRNALAASLPDAEITMYPWIRGIPDFGRRWDWGPPGRGYYARAVTTLGPDEVRTLRVVPADAGDLRALLTRSVPDLAARLTIEDTPDGIRLETADGFDFMFLQELLESGMPGTGEEATSPASGPDALADLDPAVAQFVAAFLVEVRGGRFDGDDAAAASAWTAGLRELAASSVPELDDTSTRERLFDAVKDTLVAAGLEPEQIVTAD